MGSWSPATCKTASFNHNNTLSWICFTATSYLSQSNSNNAKICNYLSTLPEHESLIRRDYSLCFGYEDRFDRYLSELSWRRSRKGWRKSIFLHLLNTIVVNSYAIWKDCNPEIVSNKEIRHDLKSYVITLADGLYPLFIGNYHMISQYLTFLGETHKLVRIMDNLKLTKSLRLRCVICKSKGKYSRTTLECARCRKPMHRRCFNKEHNNWFVFRDEEGSP